MKNLELRQKMNFSKNKFLNFWKKLAFLVKILKFSNSYNKGEIDTVPLP